MGEPDLRSGDRVPAARWRIDQLLDDDSFSPIGSHDSVITGFGTVDGRAVCVFSEDADADAADATRGPEHAERIAGVIDLAVSTGCPTVGFYDGASPDTEHAMIIRRSARASGVVPQLAVILGAATDGAALAPALADFVIMVDESAQLLLAEPVVITTVTGTDLTAEELGGARTHAARSGSAHYLAGDTDDAIDYVRELLFYLPQNNLDDPPAGPAADELADEAPGSPTPESLDQPYDVREVIIDLLDDGDLLEVQELYAPNLVVGFGRLDGRSVGIVANQPVHLGGYLDSAAAEKSARFVRTCDAFNLPVITVVDVPGFLPGVEQETDGGVRRVAKLAYAYAEATVPLVCVIIGKAYGGAYDVMGSKLLGADLTLAWPRARIATSGPLHTATSRHTEDLADADDRDALLAELIAEDVGEPHPGPAVDAVIPPGQTRTKIIQALRLLRTKRATLPPKKHGNIPL